LNQITSDLENDTIATEITELWLEYEEGKSPHSKLAKQLDKFEMIVQADEYEQAHNRRLDEFFDSTKGYFSHPEVIFTFFHNGFS
jgi:putative hydrolase of HD superfamily